MTEERDIYAVRFIYKHCCKFSFRSMHGSNIYLYFLSTFWEKSFLELDTDGNDYIDLIIIPATLILQLQFIFVGLGQVSVQGVNCLLNIFFFWIIERKESKKKVLFILFWLSSCGPLAFMLLVVQSMIFIGVLLRILGGHTIYFIGTIISASIAVVIISAVCYFDKRYNLCRIFYRLPEKVNSWPKIMLFFAAMVVLLSLTEIIERANLSVIVGLGVYFYYLCCYSNDVYLFQACKYASGTENTDADRNVRAAGNVYSGTGEHPEQYAILPTRL